MACETLFVVFSRGTFSRTARRSSKRELRGRFRFDGRRFAKQPPFDLSASLARPRSPYASCARAATLRLVVLLVAGLLLPALCTTWWLNCASSTKSTLSHLRMMIGHSPNCERAKSAASQPPAAEESLAQLPPGLQLGAVVGAPSPSLAAPPHAHASEQSSTPGAPPVACQPMDLVTPELPTAAFASHSIASRAPASVSSVASSCGASPLQDASQLQEQVAADMEEAARNLEAQRVKAAAAMHAFIADEERTRRAARHSGDWSAFEASDAGQQAAWGEAQRQAAARVARERAMHGPSPGPLARLHDTSINAELRKLVYIGPGDQHGPLISGFCKPLSPTSMVLRCLGIFKTQIVQIATSDDPGDNPTAQGIRKAARFFTTYAAHMSIELCTRTMLYKLNVGERLLRDAVTALEALSLTVVYPKEPTTSKSAWVVVCPEGTPVSHVCRAIAKGETVTRLVLDLSPQGLGLKGRSCTVSFDRVWMPRSQAQILGDLVVVADTKYAISPSLDQASVLTFVLYGPMLPRRFTSSRCLRSSVLCTAVSLSRCRRGATGASARPTLRLRAPTLPPPCSLSLRHPRWAQSLSFRTRMPAPALARRVSRSSSSIV